MSRSCFVLLVDLYILTCLEIYLQFHLLLWLFCFFCFLFCFFFVQCIIKQLLDSVFVISRIIKVSVRVISLQLRLITLPSTLIILDIAKTSTNNCLLTEIGLAIKEKGFLSKITSQYLAWAWTQTPCDLVFATNFHWAKKKMILVTNLPKIALLVIKKSEAALYWGCQRVFNKSFF